MSAIQIIEIRRSAPSEVKRGTRRASYWIPHQMCDVTVYFLSQQRKKKSSSKDNAQNNKYAKWRGFFFSLWSQSQRQFIATLFLYTLSLIKVFLSSMLKLVYCKLRLRCGVCSMHTKEGPMCSENWLLSVSLKHLPLQDKAWEIYEWAPKTQIIQVSVLIQYFIAINLLASMNSGHFFWFWGNIPFSKRLLAVKVGSDVWKEKPRRWSIGHK